MPLIDLHSHSTVSDGSLTPAQLVEYAAGQGVTTLALTDHDDIAGLAEARAEAEKRGMGFVDGVEISVSWRNRTIHVVGLDIDPANPTLQLGLEAIRRGRITRAEKMSLDLEKHGIKGALEGAWRYSSEGIISRTHFAHYLVSLGLAKDTRGVFKKYLVRGKPGYVPHEWADFTQAMGWILGSGGIPVLAHPGRYDIGRTLLHELFEEFCTLGGGAVEVVSSSHTPEMTANIARLAEEFNLLASRGSDYHGPGHAYLDMGKLPPLPASCKPVWERLQVR